MAAKPRGDINTNPGVNLFQDNLEYVKKKFGTNGATPRVDTVDGGFKLKNDGGGYVTAADGIAQKGKTKYKSY
jgi:hypothetical protein